MLQIRSSLILLFIPLSFFKSIESLGQNLDSTFTKIITAPKFEGINDLIFTSDSNLVIVGNSDSYSIFQPNALIVKTNLFGKPIWTMTYGGDEIEQLESVIETSDQNYLAVGYSNNATDTDYDALVIKIDTSGSLIWSKDFGFEGWDRGSEIVELSPGIFAFSGTTSKNGSDEGWIVGFDENSSSIIFEITTGSNSSLSSIVYSGGTLYAAGRMQDSSGYSQAMVCSYDLLGNQNWITLYGRTKDDSAEDLIIRADGFIHSVGNSQNPFDNRTSPIVGVIDRSSGQLIYQDIWLGSVINGLNGCSKSRFDSVVAVAGTTNDPLARTDALIAFSNFNGTFLPASTHSSPEFKDDFGKNIAYSPFGYYMIGTTSGWNASYSDLLLVKTDTLGLVDFSNILYDTLSLNNHWPLTTKVLDVKTSSLVNKHFKLFPNPAKPGSQLQVSFDKNSNLEILNLYNTSGQLVMSSTSSDLILPSNLNSGLYFVEIRVENEIRSRREKLIVR